MIAISHLTHDLKIDIWHKLENICVKTLAKFWKTLSTCPSLNIIDYSKYKFEIVTCEIDNSFLPSSLEIKP